MAQIPFIYWQPITIHEHMLFVTEIAKRFGLLTVNGKPHGQLARLIIEEYARENEIEIPLYFYETLKGMMQVYAEELYRPAMLSFRERMLFNPAEKYSYPFKGKQFHFTLQTIAV